MAGELLGDESTEGFSGLAGRVGDLDARQACSSNYMSEMRGGAVCVVLWAVCVVLCAVCAVVCSVCSMSSPVCSPVCSVCSLVCSCVQCV